MSSRDPRVDAFIADAAEFARPILKFLREAVHKGCPDCQETLKWGMPSFTRKGILCGMAAFKAHCVFGFWNDLVLEGETKYEAMGQFGRITSLKDLPKEKDLIALVKKAAALDEAGIKRKPKHPPKPKPPPVAPDDLAAALKKNKKASATFDKFSPSHRREYIEWITEAKREETRKKRLDQTLVWLAEGKPRNWKYMNC